MQPVVYLCLYAAYTLTGLIWLSLGTRSKRTVRSLPRRNSMLEMVVLATAYMLLFSPGLRRGPLAWCFAPMTLVIEWAGLLLTVAGLAFAIWARLHLGRNWSVEIRIGQDHELVRSGPYAIVRHPLYSGFLLGTAGTALALGYVSGLVSVFLIFAIWRRKIRLEETLLRQQFPEEYERYGRQVGRLIPGVR